MRKKLTFFIRRTLLAMCVLVGASGGSLWAATGYEVSGVTFSQPVTTDQFLSLTEDLTISWTNPTGTTYTPMTYYLKFTTSNAPLSTTEFNDTLYDFKVDDPGTFSTILKSFFDAYDSSTLRYLHIRTQYPDPSEGSAYSDDVVTGPIRIDNVAPTGTITLSPTSGNSRVVNITAISPSESIKTYWLSDSATFPGGTGVDYATYPTGAVEIKEGTSYGNVTIYAWFQDQAGNRSTAASASAVYAYTAPTSIQYTSSSINVDASLGFTVDGATTYNWTITPSASGVAYFQGTEAVTLANQHSVTVVGKAAGTFTVSAVPTAGGTTLATGTITVVQTSTSKEYDLVTTAKTSVNAIVLSKVGTGYTKASHLIAAVPNCNDLSRWNATLQAYESYIPFANDFDLIVGEPYFVSVSSATKFTVTGSLPNPSFTLITTAKTSVNAISLPQSKSSLTKASDLFANIQNCNDLSRWNASLQAYESYIPFANDFSLVVDEAYFVSVSAQTTWP